MNKNTKTTITRSTVERRADPLQSLGRAERDLIRRHQVAMKQMDRWDVARELRPHVPRLANEILRRDDAVDWNAPVIQAMARQAGPMMATRIDSPEPRPMATRLRPPLLDFEELKPRRIPEALAGAACLVMIAAAVMTAIWLGSAP